VLLSLSLQQLGCGTVHVAELCPVFPAGVSIPAGAGPSERTAASAVAAIDHLPKQEALRILALQCGGRCVAGRCAVV
jgi:hypothetical protein